MKNDSREMPWWLYVVMALLVISSGARRIHVNELRALHADNPEMPVAEQPAPVTADESTRERVLKAWLDSGHTMDQLIFLGRVGGSGAATVEEAIRGLELTLPHVEVADNG